VASRALQFVSAPQLVAGDFLLALGTIKSHLSHNKKIRPPAVPAPKINSAPGVSSF
jgi:hypothetical protein